MGSSLSTLKNLQGLPARSLQSSSLQPVSYTHLRIAGDDFPREIVKSRFLKINSGHLEYVFDCIDKNTTKVGDVYKRQHIDFMAKGEDL